MKKTKYFIFNNGYEAQFEREFDFISKIISLLKYYSERRYNDYIYSLRGEEIENDPEYEYELVFRIGYK